LHHPGEDWRALLAQQPFIRYDRASFGGRLVDRFLRQQALPVQEVCELDELDAIVGLVAQGLGVALVPQTAAQTTTPGRWPAVRPWTWGRRPSTATSACCTGTGAPWASRCAT
jgi:DNA-binding transcriptional LysR family regulator